jgi:hypothetical protein
MTVIGPFGVRRSPDRGATEQLESEYMMLRTCEYGASWLRINTNGGYAYFTMRIALLL